MSQKEISTWNQIFDSLKDHPEATLAGAAIFAGSGLAVYGINLIFSFLLPITIYVLYFARMTIHERQGIREKDLEIQALERGEGRKVREKARRTLERRRSKNG